jgi:hypothetical protein
MVTQLLFGEAYRIIDYQHAAGWAEIETQYDDYRGFIDVNQIALIHASAYEQYAENLYQVAPASMIVFDKKRNFSFPISAGSTLLFSEENTMRLGTEWFEIPVLSKQETADFSTRLQQIACSFLNTPYLWGGRTMYGMDCSGFTQIVFKIMGKTLPRDASQQAVLGEKITSIAQTQCGDLAFFQNKENRITHTGLILDNLQTNKSTNQQQISKSTNQQQISKSTNQQINNKIIIHASGKVRIDALDEQGIFCLERNEYSHALHSVRRIR